MAWWWKFYAVVWLLLAVCHALWGRWYWAVLALFVAWVAWGVRTALVRSGRWRG